MKTIASLTAALIASVALVGCGAEKKEPAPVETPKAVETVVERTVETEVPVAKATPAVFAREMSCSVDTAMGPDGEFLQRGSTLRFTVNSTTPGNGFVLVPKVDNDHFVLMEYENARLAEGVQGSVIRYRTADQGLSVTVYDTTNMPSIRFGLQTGGNLRAGPCEVL